MKRQKKVLKSKNISQFFNLEMMRSYIEILIHNRIKSYLTNSEKPFDFHALPSPNFNDDGSTFWTFIHKNKLSTEEILILSIALIPHLNPSFLGKIISQNLSESGDFPEIGGTKSENNRYFLPTGETILFLLAGNDLEKKANAHHYFSVDHFFSKNEILSLEKVKRGSPKTSGKLLLDEDYIELFISGKNKIPKLSIDFPAQYLSTQLEMQDLILPPYVLSDVMEIRTWIEHQNTLMEEWGMSAKLKPGYRALFHGPPGTGKTLTATLLGKITGLDVFRIDLSMVVSKYIGETEKNLASLFNKAQNKNWILFFDEADALFGKRTNVRDAHDKYANQEVSYLLQRIESHPGVVILASNLLGNIDKAFTRRFNSIIYFSMPNAEQRFLIWKRGFPKKVKLSKEINLKKIAMQFELSGSGIMNVIQYALLKTLENDTNLVRYEYLTEGIQKEFRKEGKIV